MTPASVDDSRVEDDPFSVHQLVDPTVDLVAPLDLITRVVAERGALDERRRGRAARERVRHSIEVDTGDPQTRHHPLGGACGDALALHAQFRDLGPRPAERERVGLDGKRCDQPRCRSPVQPPKGAP